MAYLIGTDEAGYGPNLGPLVISASVWHVPDGLRDDGLYQVLDRVVAVPGRAGEDRAGQIVIADSKSVYHSGKGIGLLERGVLTALAVLGRRPATWRDAWESLAPQAADALDRLPWYAAYGDSLPLENDPAEIHAAAGVLLGGLRAAGVRLLDLRSRVILEDEFNGFLDRRGSKAEVLSHATLELVAEILNLHGDCPDFRGEARENGTVPLGPDAPIRVLCDKHGGRNAYRRLLEDWFPDVLVEIYDEGRDESVYRFGPAHRRVEIRFRAKGERCLATALASMASKYLRELAMRAINAFWRARVPGLTPTAGYPADARRFKADIAAAQAELEIPDRQVWRCK